MKVIKPYTHIYPKVLLKVIKPYTRLRISFISEVLSIPEEEVRHGGVKHGSMGFRVSSVGAWGSELAQWVSGGNRIDTITIEQWPSRYSRKVLSE